MPKAKINKAEINYKLDGAGEGKETVVILNGIMMSTASWTDFIPVYTEKNNYQLLRVDFRDQGLSSKFPEEYDISIHVDDLKSLLDYLEIEKAHIVGISYGAMVGILFELEYSEMVNTLILSNTEAKVTKYLQAASDVWEEASKLDDGVKFFKLSMPFIYSDYFYNNNWDWLKEREKTMGNVLNKEWFEALTRLSKSSKNFDVSDRLAEIKSPTLLIGGSRDQLTPVYEMDKIHQGIPDAKMLIIKDAGHASCYEKMDEFNSAVLGFMAVNGY
jgi:pimeloyl-ACP methyl ester carboxylesterase